jgi:hypothetical protein
VQVPLIRWLGAWSPFRPVLARLAVPLTNLMFARAGLQLFMADAEAVQLHAARGTGQAAARLPLLVLMAFDCDKAPFYSALASFQSRSCYANVESDHLVSWANSSLRFLIDLPSLALHDKTLVPHAKGVVRADAPDVAFVAAPNQDSVPSVSGSLQLPLQQQPEDVHARQDFAFRHASEISSGQRARSVDHSTRISHASSGALSDEHVYDVRVCHRVCPPSSHC